MSAGILDMHNAAILQYLEKHDQQLDSEIALQTGPSRTRSISNGRCCEQTYRHCALEFAREMQQ
jgi:hypothetical protein